VQGLRDEHRLQLEDLAADFRRRLVGRSAWHFAREDLEHARCARVSIGCAWTVSGVARLFVSGADEPRRAGSVWLRECRDPPCARRYFLGATQLRIWVRTGYETWKQVTHSFNRKGRLIELETAVGGC
jgi:hypothetical protein